MEELLAKYFSGEASPKEKVEVESWRGISEENAQEFMAFKNAWSQTHPPEKPNAAVLNQILQEDAQSVIPLWKRSIFRVAASLALLLVSILAIYQFRTERISRSGEFRSLKDVVLADGTTVTLSEGGSLEVLDMDEIRKVRLRGKAYFHVRSDSTRPFTIETNHADVMVLGTSFVLDADLENGQTQVSVESGKVAFINKHKSKEVILEKGEAAVLTAAGVFNKLTFGDANYLAWKTRSITFRKSRLDEVARVLEAVYHVSIQFDNDVLKECKLTARFKEKNIDEILELVSMTFGVDHVKNGNVIVLKGNGCSADKNRTSD